MVQPNIVVIGSLNMDIVVKVSRFPQAGETITGEEAHFIPGGKGANQAVAASRLGARTTMIGAVGTDSFGRSLLESLQSNHVAVDGVKRIDQAPTGVASITLTPSDNVIVVVPGANALCLPQDIQQIEQVIEEADVLLLQLEIPLETVIYAAEVAKKHGKMVILNPAPARQLPAELLRNVDCITPNLSELELLTKVDTSKQGLQVAMDTLLAMGPASVVTTLGSRGSACKRQGEQMKIIEAHKVPVVDTTGAGDAFNAGLAYALASGSSLYEAAQFAGHVSALAVTKFGAQEGMPTWQEVKAFETSSAGQ
ncbi:ribokinase [Paenibacillus sp. NPDC056579]|uniref:ribokinase n=1 Tax=Paenibacillus sp. NPDC056579 TaxID=3345871 RepID=UPI003678ED03